MNNFETDFLQGLITACAWGVVFGLALIIVSIVYDLVA